MNDTSLVRHSISDLEKMADAVCRGRLFPSIQSRDQAVTLMLICQAEGLHPIEALKQYDIIQGRAAMKSEAMLARFQARGGKIKWLQSDELGAVAEFHSPGLVEPFTYAYTLKDAESAGLANKDNWKKNRKAMLRARCISGGVRATDPGAILATYTPEEVQDFEPGPRTGDSPKDGAHMPADAEIVPESPTEALPEALENPPNRCGKCGGDIALFHSTQKRYLGREYYMCERAYEERGALLETGATEKQANGAVQGHFRDWAEPWPRKTTAEPDSAETKTSDGAGPPTGDTTPALSTCLRLGLDPLAFDSLDKFRHEASKKAIMIVNKDGGSFTEQSEKIGVLIRAALEEYASFHPEAAAEIQS